FQAEDGIRDRNVTGVQTCALPISMMECKAALTEAKGDLESATTILRKRGLASAAKKAGRMTSQGVVGSYIHLGGKVGVLVEVNRSEERRVGKGWSVLVGG